MQLLKEQENELRLFNEILEKGPQLKSVLTTNSLQDYITQIKGKIRAIKNEFKERAGNQLGRKALYGKTEEEVVQMLIVEDQKGKGGESKIKSELQSYNLLNNKKYKSLQELKKLLDM